MTETDRQILLAATDRAWYLSSDVQRWHSGLDFSSPYAFSVYYNARCYIMSRSAETDHLKLLRAEEPTAGLPEGNRCGDAPRGLFLRPPDFMQFLRMPLGDALLVIAYCRKVPQVARHGGCYQGTQQYHSSAINRRGSRCRKGRGPKIKNKSHGLKSGVWP